MAVPRFNGQNGEEWIFNIEQLFHRAGVPVTDPCILSFASVFLEPELVPWFRWLDQSTKLTWEILVDSVRRDFGFNDPEAASINHLKQFQPASPPSVEEACQDKAQLESGEVLDDSTYMTDEEESDMLSDTDIEAAYDTHRLNLTMVILKVVGVIAMGKLISKLVEGERQAATVTANLENGDCSEAHYMLNEMPQQILAEVKVEKNVPMEVSKFLKFRTSSIPMVLSVLPCVQIIEFDNDRCKEQKYSVGLNSASSVENCNTLPLPQMTGLIACKVLGKIFTWDLGTYVEFKPEMRSILIKSCWDSVLVLSKLGNLCCPVRFSQTDKYATKCEDLSNESGILMKISLVDSSLDYYLSCDLLDRDGNENSVVEKLAFGSWMFEFKCCAHEATKKIFLWDPDIQIILVGGYDGN